MAKKPGTSETDLARISNRLDKFRRRIDSLDAEIVRLLNERAACANEIGEVKDSVGMDTYQPSREKDVLVHVRNVNDGPLANDAITRVFERIIDESRRLERITSEAKKVQAEGSGE